MSHDQFNYLIKGMSQKLAKEFLEDLKAHSLLGEDVDTSSLLNLTISVFISSLMVMLDAIKDSTDGEDKLFENIENIKRNLITAVCSLPFITVKFHQ